MNEMILISITSLVIILMIVARFWSQIKSRENQKQAKPEVKAAPEKAPEKPKEDKKKFRWSYAVIAALTVATIYLLATEKTEKEIRYVQQEQSAPAPKQYANVAPATIPEPPAAKSNLIGKWKFHWGDGEMALGEIVSNDPLKIICLYGDNTGGKLIFTGNKKGDAQSLEYEGEWTFEAYDARKTGKFHLNFHEKMAEGSMGDKIIVAEKT